MTKLSRTQRIAPQGQHVLVCDAPWKVAPLSLSATMPFLTDDELTTLTDRIQGAARIRVLKRQGIAFKLNGSGQPVVTWESVHTHSGRVPQKQELNYDALKALMDRYRKATKNKARAP